MDTKELQKQSGDNGAENVIRVCIIDDEEDIVRLVERALQMKGYKTLGISNVIGSSNRLRSFQPHIVILDIGLPAISGKQLLELFRHNLNFNPMVLLYSGLGEDELSTLALEMNADDFLTKGDGIFRLLGRVNLLAAQVRKSARSLESARSGGDRSQTW